MADEVFNAPVRLVLANKVPIVLAFSVRNSAFAGSFNDLNEAVKHFRKEGRQIVNEKDFAHLLKT
jgi:hypothetical protein